ncbi:MAG: hypothetical protein WBB28_01195 [Crinalium sp.]
MSLDTEQKTYSGIVFTYNENESLCYWEVVHKDVTYQVTRKRDIFPSRWVIICRLGVACRSLSASIIGIGDDGIDRKQLFSKGTVPVGMWLERLAEWLQQGNCAYQPKVITENEKEAWAIASDRKLLRQRFKETISIMYSQDAKRFRTGWKLDFKAKTLISADGGLTLEWRLREDPNKPESYHNQQTSRGVVLLFNNRPTKEQIQEAQLDIARQKVTKAFE